MSIKRKVLTEKTKKNSSGVIATETLRERKYLKWGYVIKDEVWEHNGDKTPILRQAYNFNDEYIGDSKLAYRLFHRYGIEHTEKVWPSSNICSIGFSPKEQKWYGWSHRALYGFGIGSKVEVGDCGYHPSNPDEFLEKVRKWHDDDLYKNVKLTPDDEGVNIYYEIHQKGTGNISTSNDYEKYPERWGEGTWTAKNLRDAKKMAIDFAGSVS